MLVLLPGLGADPRLFDPQRQAVPGLVSIPWPEARKTDTLASYGARVASLLPRTDSLVLGGSSFGGMVALEMAAAIRPRAVILIGSCRSPRALASWIRGASPLLRAAPAGLLRPRRWGLPLAAPIVGFPGREHSGLAWDMVSGLSPAFLKWGIDAILSWKPAPVPVPVRHVHGSADRIIPLRGVEPDRVIRGAGHLLTLTHAEAVNAFLLEQMRTLETG
jgi:pimeloyl-ACP methyl ester carboxylesterase